MNIFTQIRNNIIDALEHLERAGKLPSGLNTARVVAEPPRDAAHGDAATNAAMVLAGNSPKFWRPSCKACRSLTPLKSPAPDL